MENESNNQKLENQNPETMVERIELEKRGRPFEEITRLRLDGCQAEQIDGLTEEFKNLKSLSLMGVGLTTLKGFPKLPLLHSLDLTGNQLSGSLSLLSGCPKLTRLNLSMNHIKDVDALEPLKDLPELRHLDLFNCDVTKLDDYRGKVFAVLPNLPFLDGLSKNDQEDEEEDEEEGSESEDDDEEDEDDDDDEEEEEIGLSYLQKTGLEDEDSEEEEFQPNGTNEDDDEEDDSEEEEEVDEEEGAEEDNEEGKEKSPAVERGRGIKRKRAAGEENAAPPTKAAAPSPAKNEDAVPPPEKKEDA